MWPQGSARWDDGRIEAFTNRLLVPETRLGFYSLGRVRREGLAASVVLEQYGRLAAALPSGSQLLLENGRSVSSPVPKGWVALTALRAVEARINAASLAALVFPVGGGLAWLSNCAVPAAIEDLTGYLDRCRPGHPAVFIGDAGNKLLRMGPDVLCRLAARNRTEAEELLPLQRSALMGDGHSASLVQEARLDPAAMWPTVRD